MRQSLTVLWASMLITSCFPVGQNNAQTKPGDINLLRDSLLESMKGSTLVELDEGASCSHLGNTRGEPDLYGARSVITFNQSGDAFYKDSACSDALRVLSRQEVISILDGYLQTQAFSHNGVSLVRFSPAGLSQLNNKLFWLFSDGYTCVSGSSEISSNVDRIRFRLDSGELMAIREGNECAMDPLVYPAVDPRNYLVSDNGEHLYDQRGVYSVLRQ